MSTLVLFDFDGTLADTAPDMAAAANLLRQRRGLPALPVNVMRPFVSMGARGMLRVSLDMMPTDQGFEEAKQEFLFEYERASTVHTALFDGMVSLLDRIEQHDMAWGIVTNKVTYLAKPIVTWLGLDDRCKVLVCGDTTPHSKPHPLPLLHAAEQAGFETHRCIYVGDDIRDIQAGRAAGMPVVAAAYGYCGSDLPVEQWEADHLVNHPEEIWPLLTARAVK